MLDLELLRLRVEDVRPGDGAFGGASASAVKDNDVPEVRQASADPLDASPELGAGDEKLGAAVRQPVADGVGPEGEKRGPMTAPSFSVPKTVKYSSGTRSRNTNTRSPFWTPRERRALAALLEAAAIWAKV